MDAFHHHTGIVLYAVWSWGRNDGDINLKRSILTYFILIGYLVGDYEIYQNIGLGFHGRHWYLNVYLSGLKTVVF